MRRSRGEEEKVGDKRRQKKGRAEESGEKIREYKRREEKGMEWKSRRKDLGSLGRRRAFKKNLHDRSFAT